MRGKNCCGHHVNLGASSHPVHTDHIFRITFFSDSKWDKKHKIVKILTMHEVTDARNKVAFYEKFQTKSHYSNYKSFFFFCISATPEPCRWLVGQCFVIWLILSHDGHLCLYFGCGFLCCLGIEAELT